MHGTSVAFPDCDPPHPSKPRTLRYPAGVLSPPPSGPTAEAQLLFLQRVMRILDEGRFTTTYKFALLIALTNVAVRRGADDGLPLVVDLEELAVEFLDIHWGMARPFPGTGGAALRFTNQGGRQAAVVADVAPHTSTSRASHARLLAFRPQETRLRDRIRRTLTRDVIYRLQSVGPTSPDAGADDSMQFMYDHPRDGPACAGLREITLKPGVPACLRSLRAVIVGLAQARWAAWMRANNPQLGVERELESFLFGTDRVPLAKHAEWLYELQNGRCFYLGTRLQDPKSAEVDHFLPHARYALDTPANLVLASRAANNDKRDHLAGETHLKAWVRRNAALGDPRPLDSSDASDGQTARAVARWMYSIAERDATSTWESVRSFGRLRGEWRALLEVG